MIKATADKRCCNSFSGRLEVTRSKRPSDFVPRFDCLHKWLPPLDLICSQQLRVCTGNKPGLDESCQLITAGNGRQVGTVKWRRGAGFLVKGARAEDGLVVWGTLGLFALGANWTGRCIVGVNSAHHIPPSLPNTHTHIHRRTPPYALQTTRHAVLYHRVPSSLIKQPPRTDRGGGVYYFLPTTPPTPPPTTRRKKCS